MQSETAMLEVATDDRESLALCLALGTLTAMRAGLWPLEAGTWTLARPAFRSPLERAGVPAEVLAVFDSADELDALCRLAGRGAADAELDRMLSVVRSRLAVLPERAWHARWAVDERLG
jgi:hypothetical protein